VSTASGTAPDTADLPVTVSITRHVDPGRVHEIFAESTRGGSAR